MSLFSCDSKCNCTIAAIIVSAIVGVVTAFLQITGVITVAPVFLWVVFGIAVVYLGGGRSDGSGKENETQRLYVSCAEHGAGGHPGNCLILSGSFCSWHCGYQRGKRHPDRASPVLLPDPDRLCLVKSQANCES